MYEFTYHVKFRVIDNCLDVKIFLSLEDLFTPVYNKQFESTILKEQDYFEKMYNEVKEYFTRTKIVINEDDIKLLKQTLLNFKIDLPEIAEVILNQYDDELDEYTEILTPKEIIFIDFADGKAVDDKRFKSFEEDNNLDTKALKEKMLEKKYLTTDNYLENLNKARRDKLLEVVELYDLQVRGENNDLIEEILRKLDEEKIAEHFKGTHFSLTTKGKKIVEKNKKLLDFNRSHFRTIHRVSLEEFHLLSIKKEDYDFNGVGRLVMINGNSNHSVFDWNSLDEKIIENDNIEVKEQEAKIEDLTDTDDFFNLIDRINESYEKVDEEQIELKDNEEQIEVEEEVKELEPIDDTFIDEIPDYFDNEKIKQQLENYRKNREMYELNNKIGNKKEKKVKKRKRFRVLIWLLIFIFVIGFIIGLLYLNEFFDLIKLPFKLKDLYDAFKDTINGYIKEIGDFIKYVFNYKKK